MEITRLFDILDNAILTFPNKPDALACKENGIWTKYTFHQYHQTVQYLSYGLMALGLEKGDRIVSISNNRPEWNFLDMAAIQCGIIHVTLYPTLSDSDYRYILNHCQPRLIVVSEKSLFQKISPICADLPSVMDIYTFSAVDGVKNYVELVKLGEQHQAVYNEKLMKIKTEIQPNDLATLIYTSGTTGTSKGVMLSHKNLLYNIEGFGKVFKFNETDTTLSFLPVSHVFERTINYYFQKSGSSVYYAESISTIGTNLMDAKPTVIVGVPRIVESLYDKIIAKGKDLKGIKNKLFFWAVNLAQHYEFNHNNWWYKIRLALADRLIFKKWRMALGGKIKVMVAGGAALQPRLIRIFNAAGIPLVEGYGMTETSLVIAVNNIYNGDIKIGTVGPVLDNIQVKISGDGEILVKGESVMKGYYLEPELTAEAIDADGWFHTGDVGVFVDNKFLKLTDRKKEIFKLSSGKYIAPQAIENSFKESIFIEQLMVVGENQKFASALIAPNFSYLQKWCRQNHIEFTNNTELITHPKVISIFQSEVNTINKTLGVTEQIKRFRLVEEEWSPQSGILSPTLKLRRRVVLEKYQTLLAEIYFEKSNTHD